MSDPFWSLDRIAAALRTRTDTTFPGGATPVRAVSTDTRTLGPGDCFVALTGGQFDGHTFLDRAVSSGAAALVVRHAPVLGRCGIPVYAVDDTLVALGDLARYWRTAWGKTVIGVAGSNGKTSTKELIRAALGSAYDVHATTGNLNNRVGVPLTLLALPAEAECAVVEIGTSVPGEVDTLRAVARPDVAVVTCVAEEHLEGFGDLHGVLREEAAIFSGASVAITPSAQPEISSAAVGVARQVIRAGLDDGDVHADAWSLDADGRGTITLDGVTIRPPLRGVHNLRNTMLALAVARLYGVPTESAARGIQSMAVPAMRSAWQTIGRATVINDAYNANPGSARAALEMLASTRGTQRVAVLGTMRELGPRAAFYHDEVARAAVATPVDIIAGVGDFADALRRVAPQDPRVVTARDVDELWPLVSPRLVPDAVLLLKASRGVRLERLLPHITAWADS